MTQHLPHGLTLFGGFKAIDSVVARESTALLAARNAQLLAAAAAAEARRSVGRGKGDGKGKSGAASGSGALFEGM